MKNKVFSSTLKRFVFYILVISIIFSSLIFLQVSLGMLKYEKESAEKIYPLIKEELEVRKTSLYSNLSSTAYNAQAYLYNTILKFSDMSGYTIIILDSKGRVLSYAPQHEQIESYLSTKDSMYLQYIPDDFVFEDIFGEEKQSLLGSNALKGLIFKENDIARTYIFKDTYYTSNIKPNQTSDIAVCISIHKDLEAASFRSNISLLLLPILIIIALSGLIITVFAKTVSKPLNEFIMLAKSVSQGDLKVRVKYKQDKTEIGELSSTFNNMMDKLEKTELQRVEFASNVAHELRTPMTSISGFIEGILDGTIPLDKQEYYLRIVSDEIKRLTQMVRDLLVLSSIDADDIPVEKVRFDINDLIRSAVVRFEEDIKQKNISVNVHFEDQNTYVYAKAEDIERVIINLLHNAIKFSYEGGIISMAVEVKKNKVYITLRDNGIGIEKDEINEIWSRFYKSDKSRGKDRTGTGLGLPIVFSIIKRHNETISVKSTKGVGTEFVFTLESAEHVENS